MATLFTPGAALALVALSKGHISLLGSPNLANSHISFLLANSFACPSHVLGFSCHLQAMPWGTGHMSWGHPQYDVPGGNAHPRAGFVGDLVLSPWSIIAPRDGGTFRLLLLLPSGDRDNPSLGQLSPRTTLSALCSSATCERGSVYHSA